MRKPIYKSLALFLMLCRLWRGAAFVSLQYGKNSNNNNIALEAAKVTSEEVRERLVKQLAILREKDRKTKVIKGEVSEQSKKPSLLNSIDRFFLSSYAYFMSHTEQFIFVATLI